VEIDHEEVPIMKTKSFIGVAIIAVFGLALSGAGQQSVEQLYKTGLYEEEVGGDLQKAITIYQDVLKRFPDSREVAAMAQLHIGLCFEKLGTTEAEKAFRKVVENYPEQSEAVKEAKEKLALLSRSQAIMKTGAAGFSLRQVWSGADVDIEGSVSPDGRYLSFVDWSTGDLAIRDLATGMNRRLTDKGSWAQSQEFALFSKWSPDSRQIVYQWYGKDEIFELRTIDINKAVPRVLYRVLEKMEYVQAFDWSSDGRFILAGVFGTSAPSPPYSIDQTILLGLISVADGSLKVIETFSELKRLAWGFVFSPDGKYVAYDAGVAGELNEKRDIFLLSTDGGSEIPVIDHPAVDTVIGWTPRGEGLLFLSNRTGTQDVWFTRIGEGHPLGSPLLVKSGAGSIWPMGITSKGALFYGLQRGGTDVYEVGLDPQTGKISDPAKKAVLFYEGHNADPDYSPDGRFLAYVSTANVPFVGSQQLLRIVSPETGRIQELKLDLSGFGYPEWTPDGRAISVEGIGRDGRKGVYEIDLQTNVVTPIVLIEKGMDIYSHRWSKDGKILFYSIGDRAGKTGSMFVHNLETGQDEKIPGSPSDAQFFDISPDGKWLALVNRPTAVGSKRTFRLKIMLAAGGEVREIYNFEQEGSPTITPTWSADGLFIYFARHPAQSSEALMDLYRISANGGEPQKLDLTMARLRHFSAHLDGQHLVFSSMGENPPNSQVWVMENFLPAEKEKEKK
jgi:Tol biopolymer transport system component